MISVLQVAAALAPVVGGTAVLVWRYQETRTPVTPAKIVIPPLGMSTGFLMFLLPSMRIPAAWALGAFLFGALVLSWPLGRTSSLERRDGEVVMRRSNAFLLILLGLMAVRIALHDYVGELLSARQTASLFFTLAFGMILRWRVAMYLRFRALVREG